MLNDRICQHDKCQRPFHPKRKWQKYCSPECRNAVFYARKFDVSPLDRLAQDLADGPTETQKAEWAARAGPPEDNIGSIRDNLIAERAWEMAEQKLRGIAPRSKLEDLGYGTNEDIYAPKKQEDSNAVHRAERPASGLEANDGGGSQGDNNAEAKTTEPPEKT